MRTFEVPDRSTETPHDFEHDDPPDDTLDQCAGQGVAIGDHDDPRRSQHVISTFHQFHAETSAWRKQAIVETVCMALEVHAQIEEEIFYPAVREVAPDNEVLSQSAAEHDEMRRLIGKLRDSAPKMPTTNAPSWT